MRILVTGAFGWTARAILQVLHQAEHTIIAFDLPDVPINECVRACADTVICGTVANPEQVHAAMVGIDAVVHLAAATGEGDYQTSVVPFATNVHGTYNVFDAALQNGVQRVVLMSEVGKTAYSAFHVIGAWQVREWFNVVTTERELGMQIQQRFRDYVI